MEVKESMSKFLNIGDYEFHRYSTIAHFFNGTKGKLLDIGCCHGGLKKYLPNNIEYFGLDGIDNNFENYIKANLNSKKIPLEDKTFDAISCCATLEHLLYPLELLQEMKRVLKDNGKILISLPNDQGLNSIISSFQKVKSYDESIYGHHWKFSITTAQEFFKKEFKIISEKAEFGPLYRRYLPWLKFNKLCTEWLIFGEKP